MRSIVRILNSECDTVLSENLSYKGNDNPVFLCHDSNSSRLLIHMLKYFCALFWFRGEQYCKVDSVFSWFKLNWSQQVFLKLLENILTYWWIYSATSQSDTLLSLPLKNNQIAKVYCCSMQFSKNYFLKFTPYLRILQYMGQFNETFIGKNIVTLSL